MTKVNFFFVRYVFLFNKIITSSNEIASLCDKLLKNDSKLSLLILNLLAQSKFELFRLLQMVKLAYPTIDICLHKFSEIHFFIFGNFGISPVNFQESSKYYRYTIQNIYIYIYQIYFISILIKFSQILFIYDRFYINKCVESGI